MPSAADLEARTVDGPLDVEGIDGRLQIASTDGPVVVRSCAGRIEARTTDGDLLLDGVRGEVRAHSTDGKVTIAGLLNILEVSTTDGGIEIDAEDGSRMNAEWLIRSTDGNVHMRLPEGFAADLDIATGDGHITNDYPVTMQGQVSSHRLMGKMFKGGELPADPNLGWRHRNQKNPVPPVSTATTTPSALRATRRGRSKDSASTPGAFATCGSPSAGERAAPSLNEPRNARNV